MTAKERVLEQVPRWSEHDAEIALRAVELEHEAWGSVSQATDAAAAQVMQDLAEAERAELGETIAEAWRYQSHR
ncbi:MAG TPA: hypothetical protein VID70_09520 [Solirubrobacteraceae bacterium]|jgi:hypothetical protein